MKSTTNLFCCKFILALIVCTNYLFGKSNIGDINLSPRIGSVISTYNKNYFNLFPKINNYITGTFHIVSPNQFSITIKFGIEPKIQDTTISISDTLFNDLKFYVENYEEFYVNDSLQKKIKSSNFWTFARPRLRYLNNSKIEWRDNLNNIYNGKLLYIQDDYFLAWMSDSIFNWRSVKNNLRFVYFREVESINLRFIEGNYRKFNNALSSTSITAAFQNLYNDPDYVLPLEINSILDSIRVFAVNKVYLRDTSLVTQNDGIEIKQRLQIFSISVSKKSNNRLFLDKSIEYITMSDLYGIENRDIYSPSTKSVSLSVGLLLNLYRWFNLGINYDYFDPTKKTAKNQLHFNSHNFDAFIKFYVIKTCFDNTFMDEINSSISIGANYSNIEWDMGKFDKNYSNSDYKGYPYGFANKSFKNTGFYSSIALEFCFFSNLAVNFGANIHYLPKNYQLFKPLSWESYLGRKYTQTILNNEVNFSDYSLSAGFSLYLF
jgi:hypothetical protein